MQEQKYIEILSRNKLSNTVPRKALFNELLSAKTPAKISSLTSAELLSVNKSTIYRNTSLFLKIGIAKMVNSSWGQTIELSELFKQHHHHMTCLKCNKIIPFEETNELLEEINSVDKLYQFKTQIHSLELKGLCSNCCN